MAKNNNDPMIGLGGGPTRASSLPTDSKGRKEYPVASGFMNYFPDAIAAVSRLSYQATKQHHPDKPMHWNRAVSNDEDDTMIRHFLQRGTIDTDGHRHSAKMVWRSLAILQKEIEAEQKPEPPAPAIAVHPGRTLTAVSSNASGVLRTGLIPEIKPEKPCYYCGTLPDMKSEVTGRTYCRECGNKHSLSMPNMTLLERA